MDLNKCYLCPSAYVTATRFTSVSPADTTHIKSTISNNKMPNTNLLVFARLNIIFLHMSDTSLHYNSSSRVDRGWRGANRDKVLSPGFPLVSRMVCRLFQNYDCFDGLIFLNPA